MITLDTSVGEIHGVGRARYEKLEHLGISTVRDLIYFMPRAYENRGNVRLLSEYDVNIPCSFMLTVATEVRTARIKRGMSISKFRAFDESGSVEVAFFNSEYVKDVFHVGAQFRFWAKPIYNKSKLQLLNPKYEPYIEGIPLPDFIPVYPQTEGLSSKQIDTLVKNVINDVLPQLEDILPENIRIKYELPTLSYSLFNVHFPESEAALSRSLMRLAFDEMLCFGIGISLSSSRRAIRGGVKFSPCSLTPLTSKLPYELTDSQKDAINDIYRDTVIGNGGQVAPMARILVGDVGCGKTVCATAAMYISAMSKYQSALMVPTEILARQHYADISALLSPLGIRVELLLGSTTAKKKRRIYESLASGETDIAIGTHALITDKVEFANLGLIITDEQHRFGVAQRAVLKDKAARAHMLVMSATPIPRTLALTMYGDLDISRITEMPKGRQRVDTFVVGESYRSRLNDFIRKQVTLGGQCYVVCPAIEAANDDDTVIYDSDSSQMTALGALNLKNATEYAEDLKKALPDVSIGVLHGRMKASEKDDIMHRFSSGEISVIVSTTVIEVGVNVPNATLMIIENAERFGLSQLHQLRGRVGRGTKKSYCVLVSDMNSERARSRLEVMRTTYDGYEIAEKDLLLRGPGEFFSSNSGNNLRQSGGFDFKFAAMCDSTDLMENAFSTAKSILNTDPDLSMPHHARLRRETERIISASSSTIS